MSYDNALYKSILHYITSSTDTKKQCATLISAYARMVSYLIKEKESFYKQLALFQETNARVGRNYVVT